MRERRRADRGGARDRRCGRPRDRGTSHRPRDRAVSDALAYVLVFGIAVAAVAAVVVAGVPALETVRDHERMNNAERAFEVHAAGVDDVVTGRAPSRTTEIALAGGTLRTGATVTVNVTGEHASNGSRAFTGEYEVVPVVYEGPDGTRLLYVAGAVVRESRGGSHVVDGPPLVTGGDELVLPVVQTRARETTTLTGSGTVLVRTERATSDRLVRSTDGRLDVTISIESPRADAWARHLDARPGVACTTPTASTATCELTDVERAVVTVVKLDVDFE